MVTGLACPPASAYGPAYAGGFLAAADQGPQMGSASCLAPQALLTGWVTTLTIVFLASCTQTPAGRTIRPSWPTVQPSTGSSLSSVTKQPTGPQMPRPSVWRAMLTSLTA